MCDCPACTPRKPTRDDIRRQEAATLRYEQGQARDEARRNEGFVQSAANLNTRGCVFAKSGSLPNGLINHNNPGDFIPVELLTQYGAFAVLASDSAMIVASTPLAWVGGTINASALTNCLGGTLATAPAGLNVLAVMLMADTTLPDRALYTLDQYTTLTTAKTRARIHVERLTDDSVRAYGFYTGRNKDWENVPVVAATADGERFVVELGQGIQLIWTPDVTVQIPVLKEAPPLAPVWVYPPTETADKILVNPVHPSVYQDMVVWFPKTEIPPCYISFCVSKACPHPDMMEELASYIAEEMNRNIHDPAVLEMRKLIDYDPSSAAKEFAELPWLARMSGPPNFASIAKAKKAAAAAIWTKKVGQDQEWDHKPKLRRRFPGVRHKQGQYDYYYDIWSNVHYGYVGIIGGLSESVLLDGAGAEQIASDTLRKIEELVDKPKADRILPGPHPTASPWTDLRSWDDVADRVSISIGVKLANQYPSGGITPKMVMDEVLAVAPNNWGDGISVHVCK